MMDGWMSSLGRQLSTDHCPLAKRLWQLVTLHALFNILAGNTYISICHIITTCILFNRRTRHKSVIWIFYYPASSVKMYKVKLKQLINITRDDDRDQ